MRKDNELSPTIPPKKKKKVTFQIQEDSAGQDASEGRDDITDLTGPQELDIKIKSEEKKATSESYEDCLKTLGNTSDQSTVIRVTGKLLDTLESFGSLSYGRTTFLLIKDKLKLLTDVPEDIHERIKRLEEIFVDVFENQVEEILKLDKLSLIRGYKEQSENLDFLSHENQEKIRDICTKNKAVIDALESHKDFLIKANNFVKKIDDYKKKLYKHSKLCRESIDSPQDPSLKLYHRLREEVVRLKNEFLTNPVANVLKAYVSKLPDLNNIDDNVTKACNETKDDLRFCVNKKNPEKTDSNLKEKREAKLLFAKFKVVDKEKTVGDAKIIALEIIKAKLEYRKDLYEVRGETEFTYGTFLGRIGGNAYSASSKLIETNQFIKRIDEMLAQVKATPRKAITVSSELSETATATNGELGKIRKEIAAFEKLYKVEIQPVQSSQPPRN